MGCDVDLYQEFTRTTAAYPTARGLEYCGLGLASEAGEVAGKLKKWIRDGTFNPQDIADEVGDVMWYCARVLDELGIKMSDTLVRNRDKLIDRQNRDVIKGSGDKR